MNPSPQRFVVSHCAANGQPEISGVCVYKSRSDSSIPAVPVNQPQGPCTHFPSLLHQLFQHSVKNDLGRVVSMKVNFHVGSLNWWSRREVKKPSTVEPAGTETATFRDENPSADNPMTAMSAMTRDLLGPLST